MKLETDTAPQPVAKPDNKPAGKLAMRVQAERPSSSDSRLESGHESRLEARIVSIDGLGADICNRMYAIYQQYYAATSAPLFYQDLTDKTHVLLLHDEHRTIRGFTTLDRYIRPFDLGGCTDGCKDDPLVPGIDAAPGADTPKKKQGTKEQYQVVFSGDTIIEHQFWGQQTLSLAWIEQAGRFKADCPDIPLYWFLIVKGYRTYRYLSLFSKQYYPHFNSATPPGMQSVLDELAIERFGTDYQPQSGCIIFPESRGHLDGDWAKVPAHVKNRPEVAFFLQQNPGYTKGDELACITELSVDNLSRRARIAFEKGLSEC